MQMIKMESAIYCFCRGRCDYHGCDVVKCGQLYLYNSDGLRLYLKIPAAAKQIQLQITAANILYVDSDDSENPIDVGVIVRLYRPEAVEKYVFDSFTVRASIAKVWLDVGKNTYLTAEITGSQEQCDKDGFFQFKISAYKY